MLSGRVLRAIKPQGARSCVERGYVELGKAGRDAEARGNSRRVAAKMPPLGGLAPVVCHLLCQLSAEKSGIRSGGVRRIALGASLKSDELPDC